MPKIYEYVGPNAIAHLAQSDVFRLRIDSPADVLRWMAESNQEQDASGGIFATFIVTPGHELWIADRQSEHIACARGEPVASAGEILFVLSDGVVVEYVTNQSTGYCPEPCSWPAVESALRRAGIDHPDGFSVAFEFRRCVECETINLIKDDIFECSVCGGPLPEAWNF